ncbi:hypothetical protein ACWFMI_01065 [Nocardiopsis terrae]
MNTAPERTAHEEDSTSGARRRRPDENGTDSTRRTALTVALAVTFLFLLVTAVGLIWFLSEQNPRSGAETAPAASGDESTQEAGEDGTAGPGAGPDGEGTVTDPRAGLAYDLPGEGWERLGDDQVPAEYSSYAVYGSADDPDAIIVTGTEDLGSLEPVAVSGVRMAVDMVDDLVTDGGDVWAEPSGETEVDGLPAFGATMGSGSENGADAYGRFLVVELAGGKGAFVLGLNTGGTDEATEGIDAALASVRTL